MNLAKRFLCAVLAGAAMITAAPAFAADAAKTAAYWRAAPIVEGNTAYCWNEQGKQTFYLAYDNEVYAPLRTVAEWMGKDLAKDAAGKAFTLSGSKTPLFRDQAYSDRGEERVYSSLSADAYLAKMKEPVPVTPISGAKLTVDGKAVTITGAEDKAASLLSWSGDTYVPLRTAAKMMNMTANYTKRTPELNGTKLPEIDNIYIHTKLTDEQLAACKTYADTLKKVFDDYNANLNPDVSTMEAADAAIQKLIGYMNTLKQTQKPDVRMLDKEYASMQSAADEALKVYKEIEQMIKNKEDLKRIQFAITVDYQFIGYPERQLGLNQRGAASLGTDAMVHVFKLYNNVYER